MGARKRALIRPILATHISNGVAELKEYKPGDEVDANLQLS
jgi:hypothetical protein